MGVGGKQHAQQQPLPGRTVAINTTLLGDLDLGADVARAGLRNQSRHIDLSKACCAACGASLDLNTLIVSGSPTFAFARVYASAATENETGDEPGDLAW